MQSIVLVVHVVLAIGVIGLVLIQHGKGADAGAAFGSGASSTVFGARGATSFLTRMTTLAAVAFFATSVALFYMAAHRTAQTGSVVEGFETAPVEEVIDTPAAPTSEQSDLPAAPAVPQTDSDLPAAAPQPQAPEEEVKTE